MRKLYGKIEKILQPVVNLISILFQFYFACLVLFYIVFFLLSSETYVMLMFVSPSSIFPQVYKLVNLVILTFENLTSIRNLCEIHHKDK